MKDHSKTAFSVMFCCNAAGDLLPPMTVYKVNSGNFYETWMEGAPEDYVFTANKNGWFGMREYEFFIVKVLIKWLNKHIPKEEVKVLIADNLGAHISPFVMDLCKENNIRQCCKSRYYNGYSRYGTLGPGTYWYNIHIGRVST